MGGDVPVGFFALPFILMHFSHLELFEKISTRRPVNSECPHVDISTKLGVENCSFRNVRVETPTGRQVFSTFYAGKINR